MTAEAPRGAPKKAHEVLTPPRVAPPADGSGTAPLLDNQASPGAPQPFAVSESNFSAVVGLPGTNNGRKLLFPVLPPTIQPDDLKSFVESGGTTPATRTTSSDISVGTLASR